MKVHLIKKQTIEDFVHRHPGSRASFRDWLQKVRHSDWVVPSDIRRTFSTADLLGKGSHRVVFNLAGNHYRMICKWMFGATCVHLFVCWIGTHTEYDDLCFRNEQYTRNEY